MNIVQSSLVSLRCRWCWTTVESRQLDGRCSTFGLTFLEASFRSFNWQLTQPESVRGWRCGFIKDDDVSSILLWTNPLPLMIVQVTWIKLWQTTQSLVSASSPSSLTSSSWSSITSCGSMLGNLLLFDWENYLWRTSEFVMPKGDLFRYTDRTDIPYYQLSALAGTKRRVPGLLLITRVSFELTGIGLSKSHPAGLGVPVREVGLPHKPSSISLQKINYEYIKGISALHSNTLLSHLSAIPVPNRPAKSNTPSPMPNREASISPELDEEDDEEVWALGIVWTASASYLLLILISHLFILLWWPWEILSSV